jgi:glutaminyl-tRNA synthetase
LEFVPHRPLYEWFIRELEIFPSRQIEFARLNLSYTIMSKRKLLQLVKEEHVKGWDDPRMPTIHGLRRRGYTPESIRQFADMVGIAKRENVIDVALLEYCIREDLNKRAPRVMGVLNPVKLIIDNYPEGKTEYLDTVNNPEDPEAGTRSLPFSRELWIEREDFMEDPPKKFFRLSPGNEVRLKSAYIVKAESVEKDADGIITAIHCTYDPQSLSGSDEAKRKVKGTLHWVSAAHALDAEVRLYDRLFNDPDPDGHKDHNFKEFLNPDSLTILNHCKVEPSLGEASELDHFQFIRLGYFNLDPDSSVGHLVFNRTVGLKDTWAKMKQ